MFKRKKYDYEFRLQCVEAVLEGRISMGLMDCRGSESFWCTNWTIALLTEQSSNQKAKIFIDFSVLTNANRLSKMEKPYHFERVGAVRITA